MAVIKDVAKLAGLSVSTVSKYLKDPESVRDDTRQRVEAAIKELNYRPSTAARALRTGQTGMISVISPNITNPFFAELFDSIQLRATQQGYTTLLQTMSTVRQSDSVVSKPFAVPSVSRVDGMIVCFPDDQEVIPFLRTHWGNIPMVHLTWQPLEDYAKDSILVDVEQGIYLATKHLISQGYHQLAYVASPESSITSREKFKGFQRALREHGLSFLSEHVFRGDAHMETGYQAAKAFFATSAPPTGIVTESDAFAVGCMKYLHQKKISVPATVAVTGFDDIPIASMYEPPMTTIRLPIDAMGEAAMHKLSFLMGKAKEEPFPRGITFEPALVVRKSTDASYEEAAEPVKKIRES